MFRWLFLNETALTQAEHAAWKLSALRIILVSSFILEGWIALRSSASAWQHGLHYVAGIVALFYAMKSLAIYFSERHLRFAASLLLLNIYGASFVIMRLAHDPELTKLGLIFTYAAPTIARLFFGPRLALSLMLLNVVPFSVLVLNAPLPEVQEPLTDLPQAQGYIHSLLFLFFNFCLPLAVFRLLHALDQMLVQFRQTSGALQVSYTQYQEIFENAGTALLLTDAYGQILQANYLANELLGRNPDTDEELALFGWLSIDDSVRMLGSDGEISPSLRMSAYRTRDGKMVALDNISQTSTDHYIVALRDVSGLHKIHDALQLSLEREDYLSSHDALTNLPNRDMLRQYLQQVIENKERNKVVALISFRLNSIRHANQQFGAYTGDVLLRRFADELSKALPKTCFCARLRSIVFSFVVDHLHTPAEIMQFVDQLRSAIPPELEVNGETLLVQFSAGIALVRGEDKDPDDIMRRSEVALDSSRRSSDQRVTMFDEGDALLIRRSVEIEVGIVNGLKNKEFELWYQPKVDQYGQLAGVEALLRWHSATLGRVTPTEFVPIAERSGLIRHLSDFVLDQVCSQVRSWIDELGFSPVVALNLSVSDIGRKDLISLIDDRCEYYGIDASYLEFEITETGLIENEAQSIQHLNALKKRGFWIAIDDFGTGYSSLSKLSHFPAHTVKIDRSFVAQIGYNRKSEMIIKAIISLAKILSCTTVAEGVETENQERFLKEVGCEVFQGYYYHRPLSPEKMGLLLSHSRKSQYHQSVA